MAQCQFCGNPLDEGTEFCNVCKESQQKEEIPVSVTKQKTGGKGKRLGLFLLLLLVAAVVIVVLLVTGNESGDGGSSGGNRNRRATFKNSTILNSTDFSGGYAWIHCQQKNKTPELLLVDADLNIVYRTEYDTEGFLAEFGQTVGYYYNSNLGIYTIVNKEGQVIGSSDEGEFDSVLACGDTNVFVYKDNSDYNSIDQNYAIIDDTGNYKRTSRLATYPTDRSQIKYVNCDMYLIGSTALINANTGKAIDLDYVLGNMYFTEGLASIQSSSSYTDMKVNRQQIDRKIAVIDTEGNVVHTTGIGVKRDSFLIRNNTIICYTAYGYEEVPDLIIDFSNDIWIETEEYNRCMGFVDVSEFKDGVCMLEFLGRDSKKYFTVINESGEQIVKPIECEDAEFSEGIVVYNTSPGGGYSAIDIEGNYLFENMYFGYSEGPFKFYNGIGRVNETTFVDTKGNVILGNKENRQ